MQLSTENPVFYSYRLFGFSVSLVLRTLGILLVLLLATSWSPARAQALPDSVGSPSLVEACRGDGARLSLYLLQWAIRSRPLPPAERAGLSPLARTAYRLVENHYRPYADPHLPSTWAERYQIAVLQSSLPVTVTADSNFARWERRGYSLDAGWDDPPVLRRIHIHPFRPSLSEDSLTILYTTPADRQRLVRFLLPLGAYDRSFLRHRIDCLREAVGLTDWARTAADAHSPPHVSLTVNESRTRAIAGYGWGVSGGVWVLYQRNDTGESWTEKQPIGAWRY